MPLGADDVQAAELGHALAELDVGTAAGHVGGHRHPAGLAGLGDDLGLDLVVLGVQDLVLDVRRREQGAELLRLLDRPRADQDRHPRLVPVDDLVGDGLELLVLGREDAVGDPDAPALAVGRDLEDVHLVDPAELGGVGRRRAGHAGELLVAEEEVLDRHPRGGDRLQGDLELLLGLDRLVQAVLPLAAGHHTAGELVDDDDLAVDDDVVAVAEVGDLAAEGTLDVLVEAVDGERDERRMAGDRLDLAAAGGVELGLALGRVVLEVLDPDERRGELVGAVVGGGLFLGRLVVGPDDQRRPGLVDQDAVGLVDDRVVVGALDGLLGLGVVAPAEERLLERLACRVAARAGAASARRGGSRSRTPCWCRR